MGRTIQKRGGDRVAEAGDARAAAGALLWLWIALLGALTASPSLAGPTRAAAGAAEPVSLDSGPRALIDARASLHSAQRDDLDGDDADPAPIPDRIEAAPSAPAASPAHRTARAAPAGRSVHAYRARAPPRR